MKTRPQTRLIRPVDRVTDNRQHWRLKFATLKRNHITEPDTDVQFVRNDLQTAKV